MIYKTPKDETAFETHYSKVHLPLAGKMPHVRRVEISKGPIGSPTGAGDTYRIAAISFDSMSDLRASLASPEGRAAAADLPDFATGGVDLLAFETEDL